MILDEIIVAFFSLVALAAEAIALLISAVLNLFILIIELILGLFGKKRKIKRVRLFQRKSKNKNTNQSQELSEKHIMPMIIAIMLIGMILLLIYTQIFSFNKDLTFIAEDGNRLPFASVLVYHDGKPQRLKTDIDGQLTVNTSGLEKITMDDKRYKKISWEGSKIDETLVVKRSLLGSGLDILADKVLKRNQD